MFVGVADAVATVIFEYRVAVGVPAALVATHVFRASLVALVPRPGQRFPIAHEFASRFHRCNVAVLSPVAFETSENDAPRLRTYTTRARCSADHKLAFAAASSMYSACSSVSTPRGLATRRIVASDTTVRPTLSGPIAQVGSTQTLRTEPASGRSVITSLAVLVGVESALCRPRPAVGAFRVTFDQVPRSVLGRQAAVVARPHLSFTGPRYVGVLFGCCHATNHSRRNHVCIVAVTTKQGSTAMPQTKPTKAAVAFALTFATALLAQVADKTQFSDLTTLQWLIAVVSAAVTAGAVYGVENKPRP